MFPVVGAMFVALPLIAPSAKNLQVVFDKGKFWKQLPWPDMVNVRFRLPLG